MKKCVKIIGTSDFKDVVKYYNSNISINDDGINEMTTVKGFTDMVTNIMITKAHIRDIYNNATSMKSGT